MASRKPLVIGTGGHTAELASVDALEGVTGYFPKATVPDATDFKRPLINGDRWRSTTNGVLYTYQDGAWLYDNAASLSRYVPAYLANGVAGPIPLNADGTVPAYLADGTYSPFATQA